MEAWQLELKEGFRNVESLLRFLEIPFDHTQNPSVDTPIDPTFKSNAASSFHHPDNQLRFDLQSEFPLRVPLSFALRMKKGNLKDPLFLQIIPTFKEHLHHPEFHTDSVGDLKALKNKGILQKYHGRVLLLMTGACAVHCRYCFRRHFPYSEQIINAEVKQELLNFLRHNPSIEEVIFSGGDPLLLSNSILQEWAQALSDIPTVKRWRFHTRLPSVLPSRINEGLIKIFQDFQIPSRQVILVSHINHPQEFNTEVAQAFSQLRQSSITLLNQSVLLRGINDQALILKSLSEKLFEQGVLPYYLHLLDRTQGTHHFEVPDHQAQQIYHELSSLLPGYLVPKLVREISGEPYKTPFRINN